MPTYDDLFLRDALDDAGNIPSGAATAFNSPDIIVWGTEPLENPGVFLAENYETTWYNNAVAGQKNYIYCRATNLSSLPEKGRLYLYYARGNLMSDISVWRRNQIGTAIPGQNYIELDAIRPGEVVCGNSAFEWVPLDTGHYCFLAQITTDRHPNQLPEAFNSYDEYLDWVLTNPAVAWHNVTVLDNASPPQYQQDFTFANLDPVARRTMFVMEATNLPIGSTMSMVCAATVLRPPLNASETIDASWQSMEAFSWLPANFSGVITATIDLPEGAVWGKGIKIVVFYAVADGVGMADNPLSFGQSDHHDGVASAIRLGSYTVQTITEAKLPSARGDGGKHTPASNGGSPA